MLCGATYCDSSCSVTALLGCPQSTSILLRLLLKAHISLGLLALQTLLPAFYLRPAMNSKKTPRLEPEFVNVPLGQEIGKAAFKLVRETTSGQLLHC